MIPLHCPLSNHTDLFTNCKNCVRRQDARTALEAALPRVSSNVVLYISHAAETLFQLQPEHFSPLQCEWMKKLYSYYVVGGQLRSLYDTILASALLGVCPYCAQRDVQTVDHYLPKKIFPEFSVLVENLVPSCAACNAQKGEHRPLTSSEQVFHPYFDDWTGPELLKASLNLDAGITVTFSISTTIEIDPEVAARASSHLQLFRLDALYSIHAGVELVNSKLEFGEVANAGGADALKRELERRSLSVRWPFHSWRRALYNELSCHSAFLNGGYQLIDEPRVRA